MESIELYEKYKDFSQEKLNNEFINACGAGDLLTVRYLLTSPDLNRHADIHAKDELDGSDVGFLVACELQQLAVVRYLLSSPELKEHANIHAADSYGLPEYGFRLACINGDLDLVKYLLTSNELVECITKMDDGFFEACANGRLAVVKYLLTSPDLKEKENVNINKKNNYNDENALSAACSFGHLEIVRYLLTSPDLKEHADLHANDDRAFVVACHYGHYGHLDVIRFFIFELDIEKSPAIEFELNLQASRFEDIKKMFDLRELEEKLNNDLIDNNGSPNSRKMKV